MGCCILVRRESSGTGGGAVIRWWLEVILRIPPFPPYPPQILRTIPLALPARLFPLPRLRPASVCVLFRALDHGDAVIRHHSDLATMSKKRRLSPSASSRSSATPAPAQSISTPAPLDFASSPAPSDAGHLAAEGLAESSRADASASVTPAPSHVKANRTEARLGAVVPGSGDGTGIGEECFLWADLPMNKQGGWNVSNASALCWTGTHL